MFTPAVECTILDNLESYLAFWTGRSNWPSTDATLESHPTMSAANVDGRTQASTFAIFTYEVAGSVYSAVVRQVAGHQERSMNVGEIVAMQYDPQRPKRFYYAPACPLASRFLILIAVVAGLIAILLSVHLLRQSSAL